jgi:hypothetical protein
VSGEKEIGRYFEIRRIVAHRLARPDGRAKTEVVIGDAKFHFAGDIPGMAEEAREKAAKRFVILCKYHPKTEFGLYDVRIAERRMSPCHLCGHEIGFKHVDPTATAPKHPKRGGRP